jgi:hypothetical protein
MSPISTDSREDVSQGVRPERGKIKQLENALGYQSLLPYFVIVPSISEITTWSSSSQRKIREVQEATPE